MSSVRWWSASAVKEDLPLRPIRPMPQPLLPPSLDRLGRQVPRVNPDAMAPRVRKAQPDLKGLPARRVPLAPKENPALSVLRVLPGRLGLLALRKHAR